MLWEYAGGTARSTGGSHHVFRFGSARVTVPFRRPVLRRVYVEAALDALEEALQ